MATTITVITNGQVKIKKGSATALYYANSDYTARIDASQGVVYLLDITQNVRSIDFAPEDTTVGGVNYPTLEGLCEVLNAQPYFFKASSGGGGGATVCPSTADYQTLVSDGAGGWCISENAFSTPPPVVTDLLFTGSFDVGGGNIAAGEAWGDGAGKSILNWINISSETAQMSYIDSGTSATIITKVDVNGTESSYADGSNAYIAETTATTAQFRSTESTGFFSYFAGINANGSELRYEDTLTPKTNYVQVATLLAQMYSTGPSGDISTVTTAENGAALQFAEGSDDLLISVSSKLCLMRFEDGASVSNYWRVTDKQAYGQFTNGTETSNVTCDSTGVMVASSTANVTLTALAGRVHRQGTLRVNRKNVDADYTVLVGDFKITAKAGVSTITLNATPSDGDTLIIKNLTGGNIAISGNGKNIDGAASIPALGDTQAVRIGFNGDDDQWEVE